MLGVSADDMAACGVGGTSPLWRSMLADIFGVRVKTLASKEGPALGAAILAGVCSGVYGSVREGCERTVKIRSVYEPNAANSAEYEKYYSVYSALYISLKNVYGSLAEI